MQESYELFERATKVFPKGVNSPVRFYEPYPLYIRSGHGSKIVDADGNEFTDYCLAFGPLILGHSHESMRKALSQVADTGVNFGAPTENEVLLGEKIVGAIPQVDKIRFASSGTEATMHAIRLARAVSKKKVIIKAEGCFHGSHDYVLVKAGSGALTHGTPSSPGIPDDVTDTVRIAQYNDIESFRKIINEVGKENIAAVIIEPVMGNVGVIPPEQDFLKSLRELTAQNNILLISDEVITGFRFQFGTYSARMGIEPDIVVLGKIIGGGLPIGAIAGSSEIMDQISPSGPVYVAGTFSGNVLSMTAGLETLRVLEHADYKGLLNRTVKLKDQISHTLNEKGLGIVNQQGPMFQIFFGANEVKNYKDAMRGNTKMFRRFFEHCIKSGIYVPPSMYETNFVSFVHSETDLDQFAQVVEDFSKNE